MHRQSTASRLGARVAGDGGRNALGIVGTGKGDRVGRSAGPDISEEE